MTKRLGFIGIGNLGVHLAGSLLRAGFPLIIYDLNKDAAAGLLAAGRVGRIRHKRWPRQPTASLLVCPRPKPSARSSVVNGVFWLV